MNASRIYREIQEVSGKLKERKNLEESRQLLSLLKKYRDLKTKELEIVIKSIGYLENLLEQ